MNSIHKAFLSSLFVLCLLGWGQPILAQMSPYGTGNIADQNLGNLVNTSVVFPSQSGWGNIDYYPDPNTLLSSYTYDLYIPPSYDGTEPYGLITFINSGNNGGIISSWQQVLDEKKLIWVAGDNIGNSINVDVRMGVAMAAVYRLKEVLNIDSMRVYTSGNSGGARMSTVLAYTYPEWFMGSLPNCGSSYLRMVDQDYETHQPNSHYEYTIPFNATDLNYVQSFDRRYGILTSYDDFREGDIMNIYHNGFVPDDIKGKFLETAGAHCTTNSQHFRDAVNFVEHPHIIQLQDDFLSGTPDIGNGFVKRNTMPAFDVIHLQAQLTGTASIKSQDLFLWNDPKGSIIETEVDFAPALFNFNTKCHVGVWSYSDETAYCDNGLTALGDDPAILLSIDFSTTPPVAMIQAKNPAETTSDTLFVAELVDWTLGLPLHIKWHLWDHELRAEFGAHFSTPTTAISGVRLLDDNRSVRLRWPEIWGGNRWPTTQWENGAYVSVASELIDITQLAADFVVNSIEVISAEEDNLPSLLPQPITINMDACDSYISPSGQILTVSGTYPDTVRMGGCDSVFVINLTINEADVTVNQNGDSLMAAAGTAPTYQWLDCDQGYAAIPNATDMTFVPEENGQYAVQVNEGGCIDTSACFSVTSVGITESSFRSEFRVFPNPSTNLFILEFDDLNEPVSIEVKDLAGKTVFADTYTPSKRIPIYLSDEPKGLYFLTLSAGNQRAVVKLLKE